MDRRGVSLVELLVAIAIGLLLVSATLFGTRGVRNRANDAQASAHGGMVAQAVQGYFAIHITDTPSNLMGRLQATLPAADWNGAPAAAQAGSLTTDRACNSAFTLPDPSNNPTRFSWPGSDTRSRCVLALRTSGGVSQVLVISWAPGSTRWYINGQQQ